MKIHITIFLFFVSFLVPAQDNYNPNIFVSGAFYFSNNVDVRENKITDNANFKDFSETTSHSFSIRSAIGTEINNRWGIGVSLDLGKSKSVFHSENTFFTSITIVDRTSKSTYSTIGIFGRYSFYPIDKLSLFLQPSFAIQQSNNTLGANPTKNGFLILGLRSGCTYSITDHIRLLASFGSLNYRFGGKSTNNGLEVKESRNDIRFDISRIYFGAEICF